MYETINLGNVRPRVQAMMLINRINILNRPFNNNYDGLLEYSINEVLNINGDVTNLTWNTLVAIHNELYQLHFTNGILIPNDYPVDVPVDDPMELAGRKKCRRSLVNGHMLLRNKKGRFCKKKSMKRK
jgi:hypothetical protein